MQSYYLELIASYIRVKFENYSKNMTEFSLNVCVKAFIVLLGKLEYLKKNCSMNKLMNHAVMMLVKFRLLNNFVTFSF